MKKRVLLKALQAIADDAKVSFTFGREGSNHEIWNLGDDTVVIPRHREIREGTARRIIKEAKKATQ